MSAFQLVLAVVGGAVALVLLGRGLGGTRLRGRLFRRLVLVALVPALVVSTLAVLLYSQALRLLEAPGLTQPTEAGLDLARRYLHQLEMEAAGRLERVLSEPTARPSFLAPTAEFVWFRWGDTDETLWPLEATAAGGSRPPAVPTPARLPWTGRIEGADATWVVAARAIDRPGDRGVAFLATSIPEPAAQSLRDVQEGSRGLQQLRLYYGSLLRRQGVVVAGAVFLLVVLVAFLVSRRMAGGLARPVSELAGAMRRVAAGERSVEFGRAGRDELGDLQRSFADMTRALNEGEHRLRVSERRAAWQQVARRLAHEIKNPLTPIHLAAHRMRERTDDPRVVEGLEIIREETSHLERLADEFSIFARLPEPQLRATSFASVLRRSVQLYAPDRRLLGEAPPDEVEVRADEGQLGQVLSNLLKNAVEASPQGSALHHRWRIDAQHLVYELEDEGEGVSEPSDRIFEPDFTTKSAGTGLGLAISRRIVEDHGARIEVVNSRERGACFRLTWPLSAPGETA